MVEHAADYEWRGEGENAEVFVYASNDATAERALKRVLPAACLPGVVTPVYVAASDSGLGWVAASETHAAPDLFSAPSWGLLLVTGATESDFGVPPGEAEGWVLGTLSEASLPRLGERDIRRAAESGAPWAAEEGLIEEEDLLLLAEEADGDADALGRRAVAAGARDWTRPGRVDTLRVTEILDSEGAEALGLDAGTLSFVVSAGAEDLGRLALSGHRERILARVWGGDFGATSQLPAAPVDTEEARDLIAASAAIKNYTAVRTALVVYAFRRGLKDAGALTLQAAWAVGGLGERDGLVVHRNELAAVEAGGALVAGRTVAAGTGGMMESAPSFGAVSGEDGRWAWEEAGLLLRRAILEPVGEAAS